MTLEQLESTQQIFYKECMPRRSASPVRQYRPSQGYPGEMLPAQATQQQQSRLSAGAGPAPEADGTHAQSATAEQAQETGQQVGLHPVPLVPGSEPIPVHSLPRSPRRSSAPGDGAVSLAASGRAPSREDLELRRGSLPGEPGPGRRSSEEHEARDLPLRRRTDGELEVGFPHSLAVSALFQYSLHGCDVGAAAGALH
jgi:hypothetical protein